ncbi:MAG TPA: ABC transporter permease [Candidatus Limnocylindria bacterium]|nr:ABC transporter permease [Candidatus Limnocylindria bacterium]
MRVAAQRVGFIALILIAWEAATGGFGLRPVLDPIIVARPSRAVAEIGVYAQSGLLWKDLGATLQAALSGLLLGMVGGVSFGLLLGYARPVAETVEPLLVGLNALPRIALAPVLIIAFGLGIASKIFLALFTVFFVVFFNTYLGIRSVDPDLVRAIRVMGGGRWHLARFVILPSVFSWIFAALRTSVSFALSGAVVGEFVGSTAGLGYRMTIATGLLDTNRTYAILILLMVIAVTLVELAKRVEDRLLRWRPASALFA